MLKPLLLVLFITSGCSAVTAFSSKAVPTVTAERLEPGGKGLFVVRPFLSDDECQLKLQAPNGATPVDCDSQFIVGCDGAIPESRPFCSLIHEQGPSRESLYPGARRVR